MSMKVLIDPVEKNHVEQARAFWLQNEPKISPCRKTVDTKANMLLTNLRNLTLQGALHETIKAHRIKGLEELDNSARKVCSIPTKTQIFLETPPIKVLPHAPKDLFKELLNELPLPPDHPRSVTVVYNCNKDVCKRVGDLASNLPPHVIKDLQEENYTMCPYVIYEKTRLHPSDYQSLDVVASGTTQKDVCQAIHIANMQDLKDQLTDGTRANPDKVTYEEHKE